MVVMDGSDAVMQVIDAGDSDVEVLWQVGESFL